MLKNAKYIIIFLISVFSLTSLKALHTYQDKQVQNSISPCIIRFHIKANDDTIYDQNLKMQVKEPVLNYIKSNISKLNNLDEVKTYLTLHDSEIVSFADNEISKCGGSYCASSDFSYKEYSNKKYSFFTLPAGRYLSYTINIGAGQGHNWWCILYPSLSFSDSYTECTDTTTNEESNPTIRETLSQDDYEYITQNNTVFRFKYLTFLNQFMK